MHIPLHRIPAHVAVIRHGRRLSAAHRRGTPRVRLFLQDGDDIRVGRTGHFVFTYTGNRYRLAHGEVRLDCRRLLLDPGRRPSSFRVLAVRLDSGRVEVRSGPRARHALVLSSEMPLEHYEVSRDVAEAVSSRVDGGAVLRRRGLRPHLDLPATAARHLGELGVTRIDEAETCTACEEARFYSHRRDGGVTGRQALVAVRRS